MKICVFCGASSQIDSSYQILAEKFVAELKSRSFSFSYGGASVGLMGYLADACLQQNVHVTGVIPKSLAKFEVAHTDIDDLIEVESMHERKQKLYDISDHFVIFPGGMGTLDEFFEILTWKQLGFHQKKITLFNHDDYFTDLINFFETSITKGFIKKKDRELFCLVNNVPDIFS